MALWTTRNIYWDEDKDDGMPRDGALMRVKQLQESPGKNVDWQDLVPARERGDPDIVMIQNQLTDTEANITEIMKLADELWKARHPTETELDVDLDQLLKESQQRFSTGDADKLVKLAIVCLYLLGELHRTRQRLISRLRKASDMIHRIDLCPQQNLSDGLKVRGRRFHAVIAGINKYHDPGTPSLRGCVNDALLFRDYLMQDLSVPANQITTLLSPTGDEFLPPLQDIPFSYNAPTRENILNALYDLHDNPNIKPDDSIIIFYAGHGQSYRAAEADYECTPLNTGWIEAISPVDRNTPKSNSSELVPDISDREINVVIGEIARKCPNITLILDCSHAGGATRGASNSLALGDFENFTPRSCPPLPSAIARMLKVADEEGRLSPDRPRIANSNFQANMKSHVLIAAAKDYEQALEFTARKTGVTQGFFTSRLLSALRSSLGQGPTTTYLDLIRSPDLVMRFQTAFVAGRKTDRLWFV
ncbi:caspase domain-containing protein [Rhodocollybia butyracea]|uniref:Caspase domain-containing protein n=1 Tax=Rhodocollybia butyracea TaxID=206335 RepID=A0A9P5PRY0_9AGAR|nr:caspase domain-containing protein [Rhodocollybia butyracea]